MKNFKLKDKVKAQKRMLVSIIIIVLLIIFYTIYFFILRPYQVINNIYNSPENTKLINVNEQVIKSRNYKEFKKDLKLKVLKRSVREITILATYPAPNYLDSKNALVADTFILKNKWTSWEITEVKSTYTDITDANTNNAQDKIEKLISNDEKGIDEAGEKEIIDRNQKLIDQYADSNNKVSTNDGRYSFVYESTSKGKKLKLNNIEKQPEMVDVMYADWSDDNQTLIFLDFSKNIYKIVAFNVNTGEQKTLISREGVGGLFGFITKKDTLAYSSTTEIGIINLETGEKKILHQYPAVGLNSDEIYIPDLQEYDDTYFLAEIFDKDYISNKKVEMWKFSWDGNYVRKQDEYTDQQ